MSIETVSTELLSESLLAIADLRRKYLGEPQVTKYAGKTDGLMADMCPLCTFQAFHVEVWPWDVASKTGSKVCCCPWFWIEERSCDGSIEDDGKEKIPYDDEPIPDRLTRIDRWEKAITEEIARRAASKEPK